MTNLILAAAMMLVQPSSSSEMDVMKEMQFLSGTWVQESDGVRSEEHWTDLQGDTLFGIGRTISRGRTVFFEYLRIERRTDGSIVYVALPRGRGETVFPLRASSSTSVTFENPAHDFPKRIEYTLKGDELHITIEGDEKGSPKRVDWVMKRAGK
jgi:hypothetical protein